ncbi:MAG TPA: gamma-glutamyl-gamma-aminobutyrate hydrolase family protein, partial [Kineosporiaceae bacterium]|nr:gamma-glutamyl-gamma-aminobutyrate hydrolase family protein [Kineosporiaceae bacterium]
DVRRNDAVEVSAATGYDGVLLSPGPGAPSEAGVCPQMVRHCADVAQPMLGVCLGHQALGEVFGATVTHAPELMHGKTSLVHHTATGVFDGLPSPFTATRYHSLAVVPGTVPDSLEITARTESGVVMALQHRTLPLHGVQFHPESVLTEGGHHLLANWLTMCGADDALARSVGLAPLVRR